MIKILERKENGQLEERTAEDIVRVCYLNTTHRGCENYEVMRMIDRILEMIDAGEEVSLTYARGTLAENRRVLVFDELGDEMLEQFMQELYERRPDIDLIDAKDENVEVTIFEHQIKFETDYEVYSIIRGGEFS